MATVYIQPGTGTGSGTLEDPYYFDELSSAHAAAGEQGKIIFLDGDYILADNTTTFKGATYEAKNLGKAIIKSSSLSSLKYISIGDASDNYAVSKFKGLSFVDVGSSVWNNRAIHIGSAVDQFHEFESCTFKLYAADYAFLGISSSSQAPEFSTKFTGCVIDLIRHEGGASDGTAPYFYSHSTLPNRFELKNCILKFSTYTDGSLINVFNDNSGIQEAEIKHTIIFSDPGQRVDLGDVPHYFTEDNVIYNNISNSSADPAKNVFVDMDPKFVDASANDYRLRPNSPLIGGAQTSSEQSKLESQYPDGKWFDANAAAGGDGSWATPYSDLYDAIDSFATVNTATVLVKEGDHTIYQGWRGRIHPTTTNYGNLYTDDGGTFSEPVKIHSKIEFVGINNKARLVTRDKLNLYSWFYYQDDTDFVFADTYFFFKNIEIHLNNTAGYINRCVFSNPERNVAEFVQCKFTQSDLSEFASASFFGTPTEVGSPGKIKMTGCIYSVINFDATFGSVFNGAHLELNNCTFYEPNRDANRAPTDNRTTYLGGILDTSIVDNCIFHSDKEYGTAAYGQRGFFANYHVDLNRGTFTNCVFHHNTANPAWTTGAQPITMGMHQYSGAIECSTQNPKFVNVSDSDFRLRSDSPVIGGISGNSSEEKWIARATKENATYAFFDPQATGTGDGSSLVDACTDLFEAIAAVDYGGYIFVADMNWTTTGLRITKPVQIQALNPGKAIWRTLTNQQPLNIHFTGYQFGINITSGGGDGEYTFSGASTSGHTKDIDGYYTGDRIVFDGASTTAQANDYYTVANHTYDGTTHTFTLNEPLNGAVSGSTTIWQEISSTGDSAIRDMVLIDFNTATSSNGNGITFQPISKNDIVAATTSYGKIVFERNKVLQTLNNSISGNYKIGFWIRNDHNAVLGTRFDVNGNCFSFRPYPGSATPRFFPMNMGSSYLSISDAENRFCSNNSVYAYNDRDTNADFGHGLGLGFNSIFVIDNQYGGVSTQGISTTFIDQNNYFYGLTGSDSVASQQLSINPFIDAVNGDFRIRPSSELIGKAR